MEYHEEPGEKKEDYAFMQETIKDDGSVLKKTKNLILRYAGLGLIFGLTACVGFYSLKPWVEDHFGHNSKEITIPAEEKKPDETTVSGEQQLEAPALTAEDYQEMNQALVTVGNEVEKGLAEISTDNKKELEGLEFDEQGSVSGVIFVDDGAELLILGSSRAAQEGNIQVKLADGRTYPAELRKKEENLGLAVYTVKKNLIPDASWNSIHTVVMGSSTGVQQGDPVIALGNPFDYAGGMGIGSVASVDHTVRKADGEYRLLCTDIAGTSEGTGVLVNIRGEVVGIIDQKISEGESMNLVTAYGISDIKTIIQFLFNGESVPYIGINGVTVTKEIAQNQGIPEGIYVEDVKADSPAMAAGIQSGDVITSVGKSKVSTPANYHITLMEKKTGDQVKIKGKRQGNAGYVDIEFTVTIGSLE